MTRCAIVALLFAALMAGCANPQLKKESIAQSALAEDDVPDSASKGQLEIRALKLLRRAQASMVKGDDAEAAELFKEALKHYRTLDDKSAQAAIHSDLGLLLARYKKFDKALTLLDTAVELSVDVEERIIHYEALYNRAHVAMTAGQNERGLAELDALLKMKDVPAEIRGFALNARGSLHRRQGSFEKSKEDFAAVTALWTAEKRAVLAAVAQLNTGYTLVLEGKAEEAFTSFTRAQASLNAEGSADAKALKSHLEKLLRTGRKDPAELNKMVRAALNL